MRGKIFFFLILGSTTLLRAHQRALDEITASMRRSPASSSARLSTEAGGGFPAHDLAPDQPLPLPPTPNRVPGPAPKEFEDEPPSHPNPVPGLVLEGFMNEPPPHPDPVPGSVPEGSQAEPPSNSVPVHEGLVDGLPPLPHPVPGPVLEGFEDELPPSLVLVLEEFVDELSLPPVPVSGVRGSTLSACCASAAPPQISKALPKRGREGGSSCGSAINSKKRLASSLASFGKKELYDGPSAVDWNKTGRKISSP
ncbi:hypothetical protein CHARACLAT_015005 [Characodon lateralis]|uniref:Uncharacterized protein n=1 Tax=Characodon lateralis TaxID=208331 RepID=A0ABU7D1B0_9TELE|nr:hypothetical protein [Characodon lateralis]